MTATRLLHDPELVLTVQRQRREQHRLAPSDLPERVHRPLLVGLRTNPVALHGRGFPATNQRHGRLDRYNHQLDLRFHCHPLLQIYQRRARNLLYFLDFRRHFSGRMRFCFNNAPGDERQILGANPGRAGSTRRRGTQSSQQGLIWRLRVQNARFSWVRLSLSSTVLCDSK